MLSCRAASAALTTGASATSDSELRWRMSTSDSAWYWADWLKDSAREASTVTTVTATATFQRRASTAR